VLVSTTCRPGGTNIEGGKDLRMHWKEASPMSSRYIGVVALERFLSVERYRESHQLASSPHPLRAAGPDRTGGHPTMPVSRTAASPRR
jgi:hypothetical protein